jgi:hypothetical protein
MGQRVKRKPRGPNPPDGELCRNPFKVYCGHTDIAVTILWREEFLPICHACWMEIADSNLEWGRR